MLIYLLFKNIFSRSNNTAWHGRMINEWRIKKGIEGSSLSQIWITIPAFAWVD
jgi:hypothetical protein